MEFEHVRIKIMDVNIPGISVNLGLRGPEESPGGFGIPQHINSVHTTSMHSLVKFQLQNALHVHQNGVFLKV